MYNFIGTYYPSASLFMGAEAQFNFGPSFTYPPADVTFEPFSNLGSVAGQHKRPRATSGTRRQRQAYNYCPPGTPEESKPAQESNLHQEHNQTSLGTSMEISEPQQDSIPELSK